MATDITFSSDMTVELLASCASDEDAACAAWVSTKGEAAHLDVDEARIAGLINFLTRDRHGSPFEHTFFKFFIKAPIFVFREYHRHRVWSYNEESGRYTKLQPVFYVPGPGRNLQQVGKVGAYEFVPGTYQQQRMVEGSLRRISGEAYAAYEEMLEAGVAREVARMCLPLNIYSTMYASCNARALMNFLSLRTHSADATFPSHPQREIEMVAEQLETHFAEAMPLTYAAYVANGRVSP